MKRFIRPVLGGLFLLAAAPISVHAADSVEPGTTPGEPVYVDSTDILYLESWPVQVVLQVTGALPTPCHEAVWDITDTGEAIEVTLWSESDSDAMCAAVLEPVELSIPLGSSESASLPVELNGEPVGTVEIGAIGSDELALIGAGWSFGMCLGYCNADLVIEDDRVSLTGSGHEPGKSLFVNSGSLTAKGQELLSDVLKGVDVASLEATYGCPDCADGGAAYLTISQREAMSRHDMEFGNPPAELEPVHALATGIISALEACISDEIMTASADCVPFEGR